MKKINGISKLGLKKLSSQIIEAGYNLSETIDTHMSAIIDVVSRQAFNPIENLSYEPWYYSIGVAGTTYPNNLSEHETSDYEEISCCYYRTDFDIG